MSKTISYKNKSVDVFESDLITEVWKDLDGYNKRNVNHLSGERRLASISSYLHNIVTSMRTKGIKSVDGDETCPLLNLLLEFFEKIKHMVKLENITNIMFLDSSSVLIVSKPGDNDETDRP